MGTGEKDSKEVDKKSRCEKFRDWLGGPTCLIYINYFCSQWGDWMWLFASGLYLVHLDGGMLRLAAAFGFSGGGCVLLFGGLVGEWVDRNPRLYVVRIALFIQNASVMLCATTVCLALHFETSHPDLWLKGLKTLFEVCIVVFAVIAQLSSVGYKISIEKDWIVVVAADNKSLLANMNATTRTLDLFAKILAPTFVGLVMTYASLMVSAICIAVWNLVSVWVEYGLLHRVYLLVPELQNKTLRTRPAGVPEEKELEVITTIADSKEDNITKPDDDDVCGDLSEQKAEMQPLRDDSDVKAEKQDSSDQGNEEKSGCLRTVFEPFIILIQGWKTYARQRVVYAGLSLSMLYMTVMGFDSVTTGYIYSNNVPEYAVGISMAFAGGTGITGALLFTFLRKRKGLERTGLIAYNMEILCLVLAVASVWAPGSPFDLQYASKTPTNCSKSVNASSPSLQAGLITIHDDVPASANLTSTRTKRDLPNWSLLLHHPNDFDLMTLKGDLQDGMKYLETGADNRARRIRREKWEEVSAAQPEYSVLQQDPSKDLAEDCDEGINISIIIFLIGIILSRIGLWMADLVVTQLLQENVIDTERGVVNGVQNSINMLLEMLKFVLVIVAPRIETFGILIILSFVFICFAGVLFAVHSYRVRGHLFHFEKCLCNNNLPNGTANGRKKNMGKEEGAEMVDV